MQDVLLGLSGGVDSAVSAFLLKQKGYNVIGAFLKMHDNCDTELSDAKKVADCLNIELVVIDLSEKFESIVITNFITNYLNGKTPNPCVICNPLVKFGGLIDYANSKNIKYIATGHYAKVKNINNRFYIAKSNCAQKDQSYVMYRLDQAVLSRLILVLGEFESKDKVREIASQNRLICANRSDSQEICFIPREMDYGKFIEIKNGQKSAPGDFIDVNGNIIGRHSGVINYTVGQRRGLGKGFGERFYVLDINPDKKTITLGQNSQLMKDYIELDDMVLNTDSIPESINVDIKIRYKDVAEPAILKNLGNGRAVAKFHKPKRAPAKGQSAVFYTEDLVLGGAVITNCK